MLTRLQGFWRYKDLLKQLVLRDLKLKYRRSFLGYLWSVLNPLLTMIVMAVVFSTMFKGSVENYPLYLFTGQMLFNYMNNSTHQALGAIVGNAPLLKKTYVPKYIFTFSKITSGLIDLFFSMGALIIIMVVTHSRFSVYNLLFPFVFLQVYAFCMGLGLFLSQANVFFRDIQYIYNAITTAWVYLTPIFYPIERLSPEVSWFVTHCNPMYFYIGQFRAIIYYRCLPDLSLIVSGCLTAAIMLIFGTWTFFRKQDQFILFI